MQTVRLKRLNKLEVLKRIGRALLARFLERFREHFAANAMPLPPPESSDQEFYAAATRLLRVPEHLSPDLNDALLAIDELATTNGISALSAQAEWKRWLEAESGPAAGDRSPADLVIALWLANGDFVRRIYSTCRLKRLTAFEYASSGLPPGKRAEIDPRDRVAVHNFTQALDDWFYANQRGKETAKVDVYEMDGEFWYLIRHGGLYTRTSKVEEQETYSLQFRPERDDVMVFSPQLHEVRVNARTKGERALYIEQFGLHLCGRANYFCERKTYTLEPLALHGAQALECDDVEGMEKVTLKAVQIEKNNHLQEVVTHEASDLFQCAPNDPVGLKHFAEGKLARALFEIQFTGELRPQAVEVRVPNTLKMGRRCNARVVGTWMAKRGLRRPVALETETAAGVGELGL